jgi:exonuclease III
LKATQIGPNIVVVGDFNTPLSSRDRSSKQKYQQTLDWNDTIELMDLTDVCRIFYPATTQYTFFSAAHGTFSKIDHTLGHEASLNKYKNIDITLLILSDHNTIKLELNKRCSRK